MMTSDVDEMLGDLASWEAKAEGSVNTSMDGDDDDIRNFDVACDAIKRCSAAIGKVFFFFFTIYSLG
jgi:hypothetical protein